MRVLFLSDFCPWPLDNGYRMRIYHLIEALTAEHEVTLASIMSADVPHEAFEPAKHCVEFIPLSDADMPGKLTGAYRRWASVKDRARVLLTSPYPSVIASGLSRALRQTFAQLYATQRYDVVWAERPAIAELAKRSGFKKIVVDLPDIESVAYARTLRFSGKYASKPLHHAEAAKLYAYDQLLPLRFWKVTVCKEEDRLFFRTRRDNVKVVPNGVDAFQCATDPPTTEPPQLLFVGALNFEPNIDAVRFFATEVLPLLRRSHSTVQFSVIGRDPLPEVLELAARGDCRVFSNVAELAPYFDAATLFVAPIRQGSGTRLKVLEAMVRGRAVVATSVAAEGLQLRDGVDLMVADTPERFAASCARLLDDPALRRRMAECGRATALQNYHWDRVRAIARQVLASGQSTGNKMNATEVDAA